MKLMSKEMCDFDDDARPELSPACDEGPPETGRHVRCGRRSVMETSSFGAGDFDGLRPLGRDAYRGTHAEGVIREQLTRLRLHQERNSMALV
jgi:hypothetical protein